jgi:hypothetical protein
MPEAVIDESHPRKRNTCGVPHPNFEEIAVTKWTPNVVLAGIPAMTFRDRPNGPIEKADLPQGDKPARSDEAK